MKANQPETLWCVKHKKSGNYHSYTLMYLKRDSIAAFIEGSALTWKELREKHGYTCEKVIVTIKPA